MLDRNSYRGDRRQRHLRDRNFPNRSFWDVYAETMELTMEGNRLIAQEVADGTERRWRATKRWFRNALRRGGTDQQLPHF
jgi:hypothetical protein